MIVSSNKKIDRIYEVLSYLMRNQAMQKDSAVCLNEAFEPYSTYQKITQLMVDDELIKCDKTSDDYATNLNRYWLYNDGLDLWQAIKSGHLFNTDQWTANYKLFDFYSRYGNEQDYLPFLLSHIPDLPSKVYGMLPQSNHPVALAIHSALCGAGKSSILPDDINLSEYTHKGAEVSIFASYALDKLLELTHTKTMQKNKQARKNTMSSILEFCIVFTFMHFDAIQSILENSDDSQS